MNDNKSRDLLQQLHDEINNLQQVDEKGTELLKDIDGDIRDLLERSGEAPLDVHPGIVGRLDDAICHFEVSYPELTALISKLVDSLTTAGV
ncbi:MAG: hypothetical protein C3F13_18720 [Anaerolineales bacterium]|nr:DUF4404 family protein [Anaerolineae bacterium]PWB49438.1 MAG: hypothetical protein C3F13_18720 [Anaerolineales bacterium]